MEVEMGPRVKPLPYKIKAMSRESPTQKAIHVLDSDLRTHWSAGTNTKEWILLELEEACLLSHIRIHNKSVLEWEIAIGLRYKPDTFIKVRPRCEAPRRDMLYPMNYMPCRFVRISCLRGNPIAIFFVQLIGIPVPGLEPEFQPVIDYLLPHIVSHKLDAYDIYLQLLHDITSRLSPFVTQLEAELASFSESVESSIRFFSMLAGPFFPILAVVSERESAKNSSGTLESEPLRGNQASIITISSNFQIQPRRGRGPMLTQNLSISSLVFRPDAVLLLLKKAFTDNGLGNLCRTIAKLLRSLSVGGYTEGPPASTDSTTISGAEDLTVKESSSQTLMTDYSQLFGEEFKLNEEDIRDIPTSNILDIAAVEEALLHMIFACASQPLLCRRLSESRTDLLPALPFLQALLPALRPVAGNSSNADQIDDTFWQWQTPLIQNALTQIASVCSSPTYCALLEPLASYLSSYSPAQAKAACILVDLCSGPLAPWIPMVIAKVDLTMELMEDFLGVLQIGQHVTNYARAALIYIILALSGQMDDLLPKFKEVKHRILFVIEILEPFLMPAITTVKNTIAFGEASAVFLEKQEQDCAYALDFLRTAVQKRAVLPSVENEWRKGNVAPSVILSILAPHVPLPSGIDHHRRVMTKNPENDLSSMSSVPTDQPSAAVNKCTAVEDDGDGKSGTTDLNSKCGQTDDGSLLFAPVDLKGLTLKSFSIPFERNVPDPQSSSQKSLKADGKVLKNTIKKKKQMEDIITSDECADLQTEYLQLVNYQDREIKASEFRRFAEELHAHSDTNQEGHDASIDALLLAAECHLNPYSIMNSSYNEYLLSKCYSQSDKSFHVGKATSDSTSLGKKRSEIALISNLEDRRDRTVINILLQAAAWDNKFYSNLQNDNALDEKVESCDFEDRHNDFEIFPEDTDSIDAITLVRQNQCLLCRFLVRQLQREQHNMYEVLLHGLVFYLQSATKLYVPPENIVDVILQAAERLNKLLLSLFCHQKETGSSIENGKLNGIKRQWKILLRLIHSASANGIMTENYEFKKKQCFHYRDLLPASSWISRIPKFSSSSLPLVRYIGWMAVAAHAKGDQARGAFFVQDVCQMSWLLFVFSDELASVRTLYEKEKGEIGEGQIDFNGINNGKPPIKDDATESLDSDGFVNVLYPELDAIFPKIRSQFVTIAEIILDMVCLYLKSLLPTSIPDVLIWLSEFCSRPFSCFDHEQTASIDVNCGRRVIISNLKFILLRILETIILEHMEAIIPEIPRVIQLLISLCRSPYCDVPLLDSVLSVFKPLISYAVSNLAASDSMIEDDDAGMSSGSLCFDALITDLKHGPEMTVNGASNSYGALLIFLAGCLLSELSITRRKDFMESLLKWTSFTDFESTTGYYNYLCAFQKVFHACNSLVQDALKEFGVFTEIVFPSRLRNGVSSNTVNTSSCSQSVFNREEQETAQDNKEEPNPSNFAITLEDVTDNCNTIHEGIHKVKRFSSCSDIQEFTRFVQSIILALSSTLERCWSFHPQKASNLAETASCCLLYVGGLSPSYEFCYGNDKTGGDEDPSSADAVKQVSNIRQRSLETFAHAVLAIEEKHCWQLSAVMLEFLLLLPSTFDLSGIVKSICSVLQNLCFHAPKIIWRLQTGKWLLMLFERQSNGFASSAFPPLIDLVSKMLAHPEPELRHAAIVQLRKIIELNELGTFKCPVPEISRSEKDMMAIVKKLTEHGLASFLVYHTWDKVASLAASEPSMNMRKKAMELLYKFIPFSQRHHLQCFFSSIGTIIPSLVYFPVYDEYFTGIALSLLARACLYCHPQDVDILPQTVWDSLEILAKSTKGHNFMQTHRSICKALLNLKEQYVNAKEVLQETLTKSPNDIEPNPELAGVRESILQILARLSYACSRSDELEEASVQEAKELEELEIELEFIQQEQRGHDDSKSVTNTTELAGTGSKLAQGMPKKDLHERLKEIKAQIRQFETSEIREEIMARRERQRTALHARQMKLQEAALHQMELIQELDRERIVDVEREIERQRLLERERAKTREMRYNLEMELEKRTQKEIQRELEQRESNLRSSRREFPASASTSRPRERYRERDGRTSHEPVLRPSSSGGGMREGSGTPPPTPTASASASSIINIGSLSSTPTIVMNSSRAPLCQPSGISHVRERGEERSYDDNVDAFRDNYETSSTGDSELGSTSDIMNLNTYGAPNRQGSHGSKPRQIVERRERESRREGKWERKQG